MRSMLWARSVAASRAARRATAALLVGIALLATAAVAIAALPKKNSHFVGATSESPVNGFKAPVTFAVSASARKLTKFAYSTFGCFGAGGFRPGIDYYTQPDAVVSVGTVTVSRSGHFSLSRAVFAYTAHGFTTATTTSVSGRFTSSRSATGTVTFTQKDSGSFTGSCGPSTLSFTAKAH